MKKIKIKNLVGIGILLIMSNFFVSCDKEDPTDPVAPVLSQSSVSVEIGKTTMVNVSGGVAPYSLTSEQSSVATATISGTTITVTGVAEGQTNVQVIGKDGGKAFLSVTVSPDRYAAFKSDATLRFERDGQTTVVNATTDGIFYKDAGQLFSSAKNKIGYGNRLGSAFTLIEWEGDVVVGVKTNPSLRSESGTKNLSSLEIVQVKDGKVWLVYKDGQTEGRIVQRW